MAAAYSKGLIVQFDAFLGFRLRLQPRLYVTALLTQQTAKQQATIHSLAGARFECIATTPRTTAENQNREVRKLLVRLPDKVTSARIVAWVSPGENAGVSVNKVPLAKWRALCSFRIGERAGRAAAQRFISTDSFSARLRSHHRIMHLGRLEIRGQSEPADAAEKLGARSAA